MGKTGGGGRGGRTGGGGGAEAGPLESPLGYSPSYEEAAEVLGLGAEAVDRSYDLERMERDWTQGIAGESKEGIAYYYDAFPELKEMRLFQAYSERAPAGQSFENWKDTEMTLWRGGLVRFDETFASFTPSRSRAEWFAEQSGGGLHRVRIRPADLVGWASTGEDEVFVPPYNRAYNEIVVERVG
jgi:hypothetical protein